MPDSPLKLVKNARNAIVADYAIALARGHLTNKLGGGQRKKRRLPGAKTLLVGGAVVAVGAAAFVKRGKVAGLLPSHSHAPAEPFTPPPPVTPRPPAPISNYDAPGPVANTATPLPAAESLQAPAIDEAAEEAAAAAEAANIGGTPPSYAAAEPDLPAEAGELPLAEAGEGESEGDEQADAELIEAAEESEPEASEVTGTEPEPAAETATAEPITAAPAETPLPATEPAPGGASEWQTWSGRAIKPS